MAAICALRDHCIWLARLCHSPLLSLGYALCIGGACYRKLNDLPRPHSCILYTYHHVGSLGDSVNRSVRFIPCIHLCYFATVYWLFYVYMIYVCNPGIHAPLITDIHLLNDLLTEVVGG